MIFHWCYKHIPTLYIQNSLKLQCGTILILIIGSNQVIISSGDELDQTPMRMLRYNLDVAFEDKGNATFLW